MRLDAYAICPVPPPIGVEDNIGAIGVVVSDVSVAARVTVGSTTLVGVLVAVGGFGVDVKVVVGVCVGRSVGMNVGEGVNEGVAVLMGSARNGIAERTFAGKIPGAKNNIPTVIKSNKTSVKRIKAFRRLRSRSFCFLSGETNICSSLSITIGMGGGGVLFSACGTESLRSF